METLCPICSASHWTSYGFGLCVTCQNERGGIYEPKSENEKHRNVESVAGDSEPDKEKNSVLHDR